VDGDLSFKFDFGTTVHERVHLIKTGLSYRFDSGKAPVAVMAKY
jgi:hypothetical protein